jgi:predicted permease
VNAVTADYFDVMRIAVTRGRSFTDADHGDTPRVVIVNETFGRRFFGDTDTIGKRVGLCSSDPCGAPETLMEIVGVAEDAKYVALREGDTPMLYLHFAQQGQNLSEIQVRTAGDPAAVAATIHRVLAAVDGRLAILGMTEAGDQVDASLTPERLIAKLAATFGLLALALAAIGVYGLVAYATAHRAGEIGIRMALGAEGGHVRRLVLGDTVELVAYGAVVGIPIALAGGQLISSQLYQVRPADPIVASASVAVLSLVALLAGYLPARRAAQVDPVAALRAE